MLDHMHVFINRDSTDELEEGPSMKRVCVGQSIDSWSSEASNQLHDHLQPAAESCSSMTCHKERYHVY